MQVVHIHHSGYPSCFTKHRFWIYAMRNAIQCKANALNQQSCSSV